jgi:hypothetical protein
VLFVCIAWLSWSWLALPDRCCGDCATQGAIAGLGEKGLQFTQAEASRLVSNLLVTICSDVGVQPTMSIT